MSINDMDLSTKVAIGLITGVVLSIIIASIGMNINTNTFIKQGYTQENITYCSQISTKTIWVKK